MTTTRGYIAVVTAVIISAILIATVFAASASIFIARFGQVDAENKIRSEIYARSCVFEALYLYQESTSQTQLPRNQTVSLGDPDGKAACVIDSILPSTHIIVVSLHSAVSGVVTALKVTLPSNPSSISAWQEITSIPP
ncbi:MAG: hypothetical protein P4M11_00340 [Candidatus Pacebacteria bacterium]|nr:hypothetical protein [Candidatus Paceibacterota bacterium]